MSAHATRATWLLGAFVLVSVCACKTAQTPTEVVVLVDAEAPVKDRTAMLRVQVHSHDDGKQRADQTLKPTWPVAVALAPLDGDASRTYRVTAEALDEEGAVVALARLVSGYVAGKKVYVVLTLEAACLDHTPACEPDQTCHAGVCVDAELDPDQFDESRTHAPHAGDLLMDPQAIGDGGGPAGDSGPARDGGPELDGSPAADGSADGADAGDGGGDFTTECDDPTATEACTCQAGFVPDGMQCLDVDECETEHGGCDPVAECINKPGSHACGSCADGYDGDGESGCIPLLVDLVVNPGTLDPEFEPDTYSYRVVLPIGVETLQLTASAPEGTRVFVAGSEVAPGDTWTSPVLDLGSNAVDLELRHGDQKTQYTIAVERGTTVDYLKASNTNARDRFGWSVALSNDTLVVGAPYEDSIAKGVNDNTPMGQGNNGSVDSGAAYVFVHAAGRWKQQAYLKASNSGADDEFGASVAISGDTIVVGAWSEDNEALGVNPVPGTQNSRTDSGAAYVFVRDADVWQQQAYLKADNAGAGDGFGAGVAISSDTVVVGANNEASGFDGINGTSADKADDSASSAGAAYVFVRSAGIWTQEAYLKAGNSDADDNFGFAVAVSGDTVVVGAYSESSSTPGPRSTTAGSDNNRSGSGAAYVYVRQAGTWQAQAYLKAIDPDETDLFGASVAIDGDTIAVGARSEDSASTGVDDITPGPTDDSAEDSGAAFVFARTGSTWVQQAYLKAANTSSRGFGWSVAVFGDAVLVGALSDQSSATGVHPETPSPSDQDAPDSGAAYLFVRNAVTWHQQAFLKASNTEAGDEIGLCVALSADFAAASSYTEASIATGVNSDNFGDNSALSAGAVYVY